MDQLWDLGMLTSDLRPALTHPCPEQAVLDRIEGLAGAGRYRRALRRTRQLAAAADQAPPEEGSRLLAELYDHQRVVVPGHTQSPFHADARLDLRGTTLHSQVADAAAEAADVLLRLGQQTPRLHHLAVYHREFLERYGVGAEVPVLDLLNPETGLDAPETYRYPPRELPLTPSPRKDRREQEEALAALAAAALHQGKREVEITDAFLKAWQPRDDGGSGPDARPSLDIMGQVVAGSRGQLDGGDWKFVLSTGPMRDGGRFGGGSSTCSARTSRSCYRSTPRPRRSSAPPRSSPSSTTPSWRGGEETSPFTRRFAATRSASTPRPQEATYSR